MRPIVLLIALAMAVPAAHAGYNHDHDHAVMSDPAADMFPDPSDVQDAIDAVADHSWMTVHHMGDSLEGRPIRVVEITDPESDVPIKDRVVTFIMTQQHGNEPAGTPAALELLDDIASGGDIAQTLDNQVLLLMPQSNPDGSMANQRANDNGEDINRDHVDIGTPEAAAIHRVMTEWDVHLAFDHHEYGGTGLGYPSPVHIYDFDVTTMYPRHGNVREPVQQLSVYLHETVVKEALEENGYSHGDYGQTTITIGDVSVPLQQVAGGPDPGILRNNVGLNNVAGLLVESYVAPGENPLQSFERRVGSHRVVMDAILEYAHEGPQDVIDRKRVSEELNLDEPMDQYVEGDTMAPLAAAYRSNDDLDVTISRHALPPGIADGDHFVFNLDHARSGLAAAILHPESSRTLHGQDEVHIEATDPVERPATYDALPDYHVGEPEAEPVLEEPADDEAIPALMPVLALLGAVVLARRMRN